MKQRIYIDTSVYGGYYDEEFQEFTRPFFDRILKEEFILLFSIVTQDELENAPQKVQELVSLASVALIELLMLLKKYWNLQINIYQKGLLVKQVMRIVYILL